jgi:predicted RNA-binding Zn ribbon-like protein
MRRCEELPLLGGALCLDFANTLEYRGSPREHDALQSLEDLLLWAARAGAIAPGSARVETETKGSDGARDAEELGAARAFREAIYAVFSGIASRRPPEPAALAALNDALAPRLSSTRIGVGSAGATRRFAGPADGSEQVLWSLAWSAHDLLLSRELERVRECSDGECHWLFVDRSRNRSRRWCDMANCGNLAKVRRFRQRA